MTWRARLVGCACAAWLLCGGSTSSFAAEDACASHPWPRSHATCESIEARFPAPEGFTRVRARPVSYAAWLRTLPMMPAGSPVVSHAGETILAGVDARLAGVVDIDIGKRDLQQCADSVLRLRAEYLWHTRHYGALHFAFTSGQRFSWRAWARGIRPVPVGSRVRFVRKRRKQATAWPVFRAYLDEVFMWAGSLSLAKEGRRVGASRVRPGDFLSLGGSPGHAVVVLDVARDARGKQRALIGQGFMPAQSFHVLRSSDGSPWHVVDPDGALEIPFWSRPFPWRGLRRF